MRDLATYQSNYACESNMRTNVLKYYKYVNEIRQKLDRISEKTNSQSSWLDDKLGEKLFEKFDSL